ncbi:hypothetical protein [Yunchengibacter salinarum]|uniref:hypothetical protein n=1 Tax=Yunchengibacter salinarum TaxID=3133399 RepID=UPI0035B691CB
MPTLKTILRLNAASCLIFGALFLALPGAVATFLGTPPAPGWVIAALGAVLIVNGGHLLHTSTTDLPPKALILYFSFGDFAWVLATLALIGTGIWITTTPGLAASLAVAAFVGTMGVIQMFARKALGHC